MVQETEKMVEEPENSSSRNNVGGDESEAEEGEIVAGNSDDAEALKTMAPPPPMHPLEHAWTFWFDNPSAKQKQAAWGSSMRPIYTFSTVEDFWSVYNNIHHPSKLVAGADFHCFKNKIEPKWEDPVCANGGKWTVSFSRGKSDTPWLYTLLAMIGEQFDYGDEICGAVVNVRARQEKISVWTKNAANEAAQEGCSVPILIVLFRESITKLRKKISREIYEDRIRSQQANRYFTTNHKFHVGRSMNTGNYDQRFHYQPPSTSEILTETFFKYKSSLSSHELLESGNEMDISKTLLHVFPYFSDGYRWSIILFIVHACLVRCNPLRVSEIFQLSIGKQWKEFLDYNDSIGFIFHEEAKRLDRVAKNRYTL